MGMILGRCTQHGRSRRYRSAQWPLSEGAVRSGDGGRKGIQIDHDQTRSRWILLSFGQHGGVIDAPTGPECLHGRAAMEGLVTRPLPDFGKAGVVHLTSTTRTPALNARTWQFRPSTGYASHGRSASDPELLDSRSCRKRSVVRGAPGGHIPWTVCKRQVGLGEADLAFSRSGSAGIGCAAWPG